MESTELQGIHKLPTRAEPYRRLVQFGFLALTVWIGYRFVLFVAQLEAGIPAMVPRPPGVEAFLPISSLISLKYWLLTGVWNDVHPAGLALFLLILGIGFALKKAFCSWVCPFGLLSEYLEKLHRVLFRRQIRLPGWVDFPLRGVKYLLLAFFLWAILLLMGEQSLARFIDSPYNRVADIKMLKFFALMSDTTMWVLLILLALSVVIPYFWCRFLCPYGALLGVVSIFSPLKVRRKAETCTDCQRCTAACPASIAVERLAAVSSDECHACLRCVDACPVEGTLHFSLTARRGRLSGRAIALIIVLAFVLVSGTAHLAGRWQTSITLDEYRYHVQHLDEYGHNRGIVE